MNWFKLAIKGQSHYDEAMRASALVLVVVVLILILGGGGGWGLGLSDFVVECLINYNLSRSELD